MNRVITVDEVGRHEMGSAAGVLARGMRDNPVHEAAFGEDPSERRRILERFFGSFLPTMRRAPICARSGHEIVGVLGLAPPALANLRRGMRSASSRRYSARIPPPRSGRSGGSFSGRGVTPRSDTGTSARSPSSPNCKGEASAAA